MSDGPDSIRIGQIYASTHSGDIDYGRRQCRVVVDVQFGPDSFVWLQSNDTFNKVGPSRVRLRSPRARTIPGHRLVQDVS